MAGIGVRLNQIYGKNTLTTNIVGMGYSTIITIAPMLFVIGAILVMQVLLDTASCGYSERELFACTVLYIFIFSLLTASPFNSVLSRYMSDVIYEERFEDIMPCFYVGVLMNITLSTIVGVPFCVWEFVVGKIPLYYVFTGYSGYIALMLVFYSMLYLSICKDYKKISKYFFIGMAITIVLSLILSYWFGINRTYSMLVSLVVGFIFIGVLEYAVIQSYFHENSGEYKRVLSYFRRYWKLVVTNFLYILGLYTHNFVFWTTDLHMIVAKSFVCVTSYDTATCLAMFTNISSSVIFISRVEMHFHERYKAYSEAVIGGRDMDIELTKNRMFRQLAEELMSLVRIQFIVTVIIFFICIILLPQFGYGGMVMKIYPCLAAGYFILFTMYAAIIFLYYFNDMTGSLLTAGIFCLVTMLGSIFATTLTPIWYGIGVVIGSFAGFGMAYYRIHWLEKNLDEHIFCRGSILEPGNGKRPSTLVFDRYSMKKENNKEAVE